MGERGGRSDSRTSTTREYEPMRRPLWLLLPLLALALVLAPRPGKADDKETIVGEELKVKSAFQNTDGASLVAFLRTRAKGEATKEKLTELIEALEEKSASKRQKACAELVAIGAPAIPMLRQAARDVDSPDTAALAKRCLKAIEEEGASLTTAIVRILAARKPTGTAQALLEYLPHSDNTEVMEEIKTALSGV